MGKADDTVQLTLGQAIVRWMANQYIVIDGQEKRLFGGGFGIFGHGNVPCLGEALYQSVSYTHLRAHETKANLVCRLLLEKKK